MSNILQNHSLAVQEVYRLSEKLEAVSKAADDLLKKVLWLRERGSIADMPEIRPLIRALKDAQ